MIDSIILLSFALAAGIVGSWEKLFAPNPGKRKLGMATLSILLGSLLWQGYLQYSESEEHESLDDFVNSQEKRIQEASGAAFLKDKLFIVDDERPSVYEYRYDDSRGKATWVARYGIQPAIDDLEGAAAYRDKLYVVSSHSLNKKGQCDRAREWFYEIDPFKTRAAVPPKPECKRARVSRGDPVVLVQRKVSLIPMLDSALERARAQGSLEGEDDDHSENIWANIEGLAIDEKGAVYIGLRNPLLVIEGQRYAIVLRTTVEKVFSGSMEADLLKLRLEKGDRSYGVTSLDYDQGAKEMLVLGNSPRKSEHFPPKIWRWQPDEKDTYEPDETSWSLPLPDTFDAKPEALVLPGEGRPGLVFLDAPSHGGQRKIPRGELD